MLLLKKDHNISSHNTINGQSFKQQEIGLNTICADFNKNKKKRLRLTVALVFLLLVSMIVSSCMGAVKIPLADFFDLLCAKLGIIKPTDANLRYEAVLFTLRIPRMLQSVIVGAGLAASGTAIQGLFRNPLAEPSLIGISSGASLFAILFIVIGNALFSTYIYGIGDYALAIAAFLGASITTTVIYKLSVSEGRSDIATLLLGGIAINALAGAIIGLMTYLSSDEQLRSITFWSLGSLGAAGWKSVSVLAVLVGIPVISLPLFSKSLDAMMLGESQAAYLGINVSATKRRVIILTTIAVGASVAMCGMIGFVGLVVPHIIRLLAGASYRVVFPLSALLGASVLSVSDLIARTIVTPAELPIGIVTALLGGPLFIYMIFKEKRGRRV